MHPAIKTTGTVKKYKLVKPLLPIVRWTLLHLYYNRRFHRYNNHFFESLPDRQWMNNKLLSKLAEIEHATILYVGCAPYTWKSLKRFKKSINLITVDYRRRNILWGGKKHLVADIQEIDKLLHARSFDIILLNGIFGHGVNTEEAQTKTYLALHKILKPEGLLLVGWNHDISADPLNNVTCKALYYKANLDDLPARTKFDNSTHVFDFLRAKSTKAIQHVPLNSK